MAFNVKSKSSYNQPTHELKLIVNVTDENNNSYQVTLGYLGLFENNETHNFIIENANDESIMKDLLNNLVLEVQEAGVRPEKPKRTIRFG